MSAADEITAACSAVRNVLGETVVYRRGAQLAQDLTAVVGSTLFKSENDRGAVIFVRSVDFHAALADLAFLPGGLPAEGDVLERFLGAGRRSEKHEVTRFNDEPAWRWRDAAHTELRIHTRLVDSQTPLP